MASGREKQLNSSSDDVEYEPQPAKRKKMSSPSAGPSRSAGRDVEKIAQSAEMNRLEKKLKAFARDIKKAFPWTKFGSDRDAFCYRRVRGHVAVFKRESLEQCKNFIDERQWKRAIDYAILAWQYVDELPRWDDPKHNKMNEQCYKKLTSYLTTSFKKGAFEKQELQNYIDRLQNLAEASDEGEDNGIQDSIKVAQVILKKMK